MRVIRSQSREVANFFPILVLGGLLTIPTWSMAADMSSTKTPGKGEKPEDTQISNGHRSIEGIVEEVNENTIRVNAGEAGAMSPRYLNFHHNIGNEEVKVGDTIQIELNAQNEVVRYQKIEGSGKKKM